MPNIKALRVCRFNPRSRVRSDSVTGGGLVSLNSFNPRSRVRSDCCPNFVF